MAGGVRSESAVSLQGARRRPTASTLSAACDGGIEDHQEMKEQRPGWLGGWPLAVAGVVVISLAVLVVVRFRSGIVVTVENAGPASIKSVSLRVTGRSYSLGEIAAGSSASARVHPTGESHLEIELAHVDGTSQRLDAGGYFESGYRGTIRVVLKDGKIEQVEDAVKIW